MKEYYLNNIKLHQILADSLNNFVVRYNTEVIIRKRPDLGNKIVFRCQIKGTNDRTPIEFDSLLNRNDLYPFETSRFIIPIEIIKLFKALRYTSLIADGNDGLFWGDAYDFNGNSQTGIIINHEEEKKKDEYILRLGKNVYITRRIIP